MSRAAGNSNLGGVCASAFKIARNAGGRTWSELQYTLPQGENVSDRHWLDPVTDLWIPEGMAPLHQPQRKKRDRIET